MKMDFEQYITPGIETPEEDYEPPKYSDVGRILVRVDLTAANCYDDKFEVIDYDGCAFWISEGEGFEYWLDELEFLRSGIYLISNITGYYHRGNWSWGEDDNVEWDHDPPWRVSLWWRFKQWIMRRELP